MKQERRIGFDDLEAASQMTRGVGHDLANLICAIDGFSDLLRQRVSDERAVLYVDEIKKATERAARLSRQLLTVSRKRPMTVSAIDMNPVVSDMHGMLATLLGDEIRLEIELDSQSLLVMGNRSQLEQVITNLAVNARDAMPAGGTVRVETRATCVGPGESGPAGDYVLLTVSDSGAGMDDATRNRIFEPFFTTKTEGKGTGLGLATVAGIVRSCGGYVEVDSWPGAGTCFRVFFPSTRARPTEAAAERPAPAPGTILVAEDEAGVRRYVRETLLASGYAVLDTGDPFEAEAIYEREGDRVSLLLTDVMMPGQTGPELVRKLHSQRSDLPVLYMSGFTANALGREGIIETDVELLRKPFPPEALAERVQSILASA